MKAVLQGANTIVVQPTGKSLCYQFPPFVTGGTAVIVSPTLSLIHDQTEDLCAKGIAATYQFLWKGSFWARQRSRVGEKG